MKNLNLKSIISFLSGSLVTIVLYFYFWNFLISSPGNGDFILFFPIVLGIIFILQIIFYGISTLVTKQNFSNRAGVVGLVSSPFIAAALISIFAIIGSQYDQYKYSQGIAPISTNGITYNIKKEAFEKGKYIIYGSYQKDTKIINIKNNQEYYISPTTLITVNDKLVTGEYRLNKPPFGDESGRSTPFEITEAKIYSETTQNNKTFKNDNNNDYFYSLDITYVDQR